MSAKRSIARFLAIRAEYPDSYAIWHSRIATHGVKNESNCHPFRVGGDKLTYLAHNGVLSVCQDKDDKRSDTRVFAEEVLPAMGGVTALDNETVFDMVCDWARGSKIAILTIDPRAKKSLYIINQKSGEWDDNSIWWSNTRHRPKPSYASDWGSSAYRYGAYKQNASATKVISYINRDSGLWEANKSIVVTYRAYEIGDIWDQSLYSFRTPLPGTAIVVPSTTTALAIVKDWDEVEEAIEEVASSEVVCPQCHCTTDLEYDSNYCMICALCFDCGASYYDCLCYNPSLKTYKDYTKF